MTLASAYGRFNTSHVASCPDVAPECATIAIPDHRHVVTLGLFHTELVADYGATSGVTASLRLPYDLKAQKVRYTTLAGDLYAPPYGDIHHRTETLRGVSDGQLTALFALGGSLQAGVGLSLPLGRTEENPIELGREGKKHEHIQFGSGTVDPIVSLVWSRPVGPVVLAASADAQLPLYRNSKGFKAPLTVRYSVGPSLPLGSTGLALQYAGQYQSIGRWNGEEDEGTGFHNGGVFLRATFLPWKGFRISPGVYREIYSKSLSDESFRQGTTWSLTLTRFF
ncbi:MAG: hypothetical protein LC796_16270 [Acidobacteria bacterium]|nr:hypothetical protein [Acidobacteriota bacterium]